MGHGDDARTRRPDGAGRAVQDRRWARDLVSAGRCAVALLTLLLLIDWGADTLSVRRGALWGTLALLLFLTLCPDRIRAGEGWLTSRRLLRTRRVRTDLLVSVRCLEGITQRLVFRDVFGERVELDPRVLVDNPDLWHRLHQDARRSLARGTLQCGSTALERLAERLDRETARTVFDLSDLQ